MGTTFVFEGQWGILALFFPGNPWFQVTTLVRRGVIVAGGSVHKIRREVWTMATFSCCVIPPSSGVFVLIAVGLIDI